MAKKLVNMAIAYDFDGTLAPGNMQEYDFIPKLRMKSKGFWDEVSCYAREQNADQILAYMYLMLKKAESAEVQVRKSDFHKYGEQIQLFLGVAEWFQRINEYGRAKNIRVEHYIVSSGLREMVEGTSIVKDVRSSRCRTLASPCHQLHHKNSVPFPDQQGQSGGV